MIKLSNFWENWKEFSELCLSSGTNDTKYKIKIIETYFNLDEFEGSWENLLESVIYIFVNDIRISKKFDYTTEQRIYFQEIFKSKTTGIYSDTLKKLNVMLSDNFYGGKQWGSPTSYYNIICNINLIDKKSKNLDIKYIAQIKSNKKIPDFYNIDIFDKNNNKIIGQLLIVYKDSKYSHTINLDTGTKTQISKYAEIVYFIDMYFHKNYLTNFSFFVFSYLTKSFIKHQKLFLPDNNYLNKLNSNQSIIISDINKLTEYLENVNNQVDNKLHSFSITLLNRFVINKNNDDEYNKMRSEDENFYGDIRSANKSRKGPFIIPK